LKCHKNQIVIIITVESWKTLKSPGPAKITWGIETSSVKSGVGTGEELGSLTTKFGPISEIDENPNRDKYLVLQFTKCCY